MTTAKHGISYTQRKRERNHGRWYKQTERGAGWQQEERIRTAIDDIEEAVKISN